MNENPFKLLLKQSALFCFYLAGFAYPRRKPPILIYHSVDTSGSPISIDPQTFERQMKYISDKNYETLTVSSLVDSLRNSQPLPRRSVVLTFDDGIESVYKEAFPILKNLRLTATVFLSTNHIGGMTRWDRDERVPEFPMLSWDMIREMGDYGIDFQSHTATHPHLPLVSDDRIKTELNESRRQIENQLRKTCNIFCYPYNEFDERVIGVVKNEGYVAALAGHEGRDDLYSLRRVGSAQISSFLGFKTALKGTFPLYYSAKKKMLPSPVEDN